MLVPTPRTPESALDISFNSLLEMQAIPFAVIWGGGVVFQFSIGDAVHVWPVEDGGKTCFNSLLEMRRPAPKASAEALAGFNSLLEMPGPPEARRGTRPGLFQFSIGDALQSAADAASQVQAQGFNSLLEMLPMEPDLQPVCDGAVVSILYWRCPA